MDFVTIETLKTFAGASAAVALLTGAVKMFAPRMTGRGTQLFAGVVSLVLAALIFAPASLDGAVLTVVNAVTILAAASGWDQLVNYKR